MIAGFSFFIPFPWRFSGGRRFFFAPKETCLIYLIWPLGRIWPIEEKHRHKYTIHHHLPPDERQFIYTNPLETKRNCWPFWSGVFQLFTLAFSCGKLCRKVSATRCECVEFCMLKFMLPDTPLCVTKKKKSGASSVCFWGERHANTHHDEGEYSVKWGWVFRRSFLTGVQLKPELSGTIWRCKLSRVVGNAKAAPASPKSSCRGQPLFLECYTVTPV